MLICVYHTSTRSEPLSVNLTFVPVCCMAGHTGWVTCVELTPDCTMVVTGSKDAHIMVWDTETGAVIRRLAQDAEITCLLSYPLLSDSQ